MLRPASAAATDKPETLLDLSGQQLANLSPLLPRYQNLTALYSFKQQLA